MIAIQCVNENSDEIEVIAEGRIDTLSADKFAKSVSSFHEKNPDAKMILDFQKVEIITSAGLREILRFIKQGLRFKLTNVNSDVFAVMKLSGFLNYIEIERPVKYLNLEGCELIGKGANAEVYRLNDEQVIKVYKRSPDIDEIIRERMLSKKAVKAGVPAAISFGMAEVNGDPGLIFELIKARSFAYQIGKDPKTIEKYIDNYVKTIKTIHAIDAEKDFDYPLDSADEIFCSYIDYLGDYLDVQLVSELRRFAETLPKSKMLLHGDIQPGNVMITDQDMVFIDMDSLAKGPEIYDLGYLYRTMILFWQIGPQESFLRFDEVCSRRLWEGIIQRYYAGEDGKSVNVKLQQIEIIGLVSICRKLLKRKESQEATEKIVKQLKADVSEYFREIQKER